MSGIECWRAVDEGSSTVRRPRSLGSRQDRGHSGVYVTRCIRTAAEQEKPLSTMADSLPGLGIVAAVLGVVITMGALGGPPEEIGHKVAAALVGTFLGILLCYGLVGPIAANMAKIAEDEHAYLYMLRVLMISFLKGTAPIMAVEVARRAIPGHVRPSFKELEALCRGGGGDAAPADKAAAASG